MHYTTVSLHNMVIFTIKDIVNTVTFSGQAYQICVCNFLVSLACTKPTCFPSGLSLLRSRAFLAKAGMMQYPTKMVSYTIVLNIMLKAESPPSVKAQKCILKNKTAYTHSLFSKHALCSLYSLLHISSGVLKSVWQH